MTYIWEAWSNSEPPQMIVVHLENILQPWSFLPENIMLTSNVNLYQLQWNVFFLEIETIIKINDLKCF